MVKSFIFYLQIMTFPVTLVYPGNVNFLTESVLLLPLDTYLTIFNQMSEIVFIANKVV